MRNQPKHCVIDLNGKPLIVENLKDAIHQAEQFVRMTEGIVLSEFDKKNEAYWKDLLQKLKVLEV